MEQKEAQRLLGFIMTNNKEARHLVGLSELRRQDSRSAQRDASLCEELRPGACEESCRSKTNEAQLLLGF